MAGDAPATPVFGGMAPGTLPETRPDEHVSIDGRLSPADRERLRRIPSFKNAWSVVWLYGQTLLILAVAVRISHPVTWVVAFVLMGRAHAQFASLAHEAAHRTLFRHKDRKSTRLNSSHMSESRMPSSA